MSDPKSLSARDARKVIAQLPGEAELAASWAERRMREQQDANCISFWYPRIRDVVPTPKTELVTLNLTREQDQQLWAVLDGAPAPDWLAPWCEELAKAARAVSQSGPWFLRTGVFSGKHEWERTCALQDLNRLPDHVLAIFQLGLMVDFVGLLYHMWAVREWLPGPALFTYAPYGNMPVRREFRVFAEGGRVHCVHPYWPPDVFTQGDANARDWADMNELGADEIAVRKLATLASRQVPGPWSIDCLWTPEGWYVTDMAQAAKSWHWPGCPQQHRYRATPGQ